MLGLNYKPKAGTWADRDDDDDDKTKAWIY